MHFLLLVLRMVLDWLLPAWRDSLQLAARADGRLEHVPTQGGLWSRWLSRLDCGPPRKVRTALAVRALGDKSRGEDSRGSENPTTQRNETGQ
jgi:hypothetical protein